MNAYIFNFNSQIVVFGPDAQNDFYTVNVQVSAGVARMHFNSAEGAWLAVCELLRVIG